MRTGSIPALLLSALLIAVSGPGAAASHGRTLAQGSATPLAATDPVGTLAAELQYDPQKIFRYVADNIIYEPYDGVLRGAVGTLQARAGNSADKALLLAALLQDSQVSYRFARGPIDAATTARIVATLATDPASAKELAQAPLTQAITALAGPGTPAASASGPLASLYDQQAQAAVAAATKRLDQAKTQLSDTVKTIEDALSSASVQLPSDSDVTLPPIEQKDHTWVEMANGTEWVDLDPTLPGAAPGDLLTKPAETLTQLPDELRYKVEFDVLVERMSGGQLVTDNDLTVSDFADALAGTPVTFGHTTPSGLQNLGVAINSLLGDGWLDYRPTIEVGSRSFIADEAVGFPGPNGGGGIFGEEPSPGSGPLDGEATAEWLQVQVTPPGAKPDIARRTVFDRLPADLRASGQLTPSAVEPLNLVDFKGTGSLDYLPMMGLEKFAISTGTTGVTPAATTDDALARFAFAYHDVRDAIDAQVALDAGARTFDDGPNIVSLSVIPNGDSEASKADVGLDIWIRSHGVLPLTGSTLSAAQSRLVAGVTDHVAEQFAVGSFADTLGAPKATIGVSDVFAAAASQGIPTVVLNGTAPQTLPYDAPATSLIKDALAAGDVVVVPAKPVTVGGSPRIGWWTVDPSTGDTTDVMDTGSGQELAEEAVIIDSEFGRLICFGSMAMAAAEVILLSAAVVGGLALSGMYHLFANGVGDTSCAAV